MLNKKSIVEEIDSIEEQIKKLENLKSQKVELLKKENLLDFYTWCKYGDKENYEWIIGSDKAPLIYQLVEECERYRTVTLDDILEWSADWDEEEIEKLEIELMKLNFSSMVIDW